jgi:hypothetical protein
MTESGLQYTDLVQGTGEAPKPGDTVVIDWDGYTIGVHPRSRPLPSSSLLMPLFIYCPLVTQMFWFSASGCVWVFDTWLA